MTVVSVQQFDVNLKALTRFQPQIAARIQAEPIPDGVRLATGRDGCATYRVPGACGSMTWFGRSSMPTISAPAWLSGFRGDGGHVLLPGIHTGLEPVVLADRLPVNAAVFVAEPSILPIKLAMHLHDYSGLWNAHRLVLLAGTDLVACFQAFFDDHSGFDLPTQLVPPPDWTQAEIRAYQIRLEQAGEAAREIQERKLANYRVHLNHRAVVEISDKPSVAILSLDCSRHTRFDADRVARAAAALGWRTTMCLSDTPDRGNVVARVAAMHDAGAELPLFVNSGGGRFLSAVHPRQPVAMWFLSQSVPARVDTALQNEGCRWFVESPAIADSLMDQGVPADRIECLPPGADPAWANRDDRLAVDGAGDANPVALMANVPDDSPEAADLRLASYAALWRAMLHVGEQRVDEFDESTVEKLIAGAQEQSGVRLQEQDVRARFTLLFRSRVGPACAARSAMQVLKETGRGCRVWGENWDCGATESSIRYAGPLPSGDALYDVLTQTTVIVLPTTTPEAVQVCLDAMALGRRVIWRWSCDGFVRRFPGLAPLSRFIHFYRSRADLARLVGELSASSGGTLEIDRESMWTVRSDHCMKNRLCMIADVFRQQRS